MNAVASSGITAMLRSRSTVSAWVANTCWRRMPTRSIRRSTNASGRRSSKAAQAGRYRRRKYWARSRPSGVSCGPSSAADHGRGHVQLAPPRQLGQARDVHRVQPHRRARHHAHRGARVGRVGQQPQPGQQVAHLGALEVRGRAVQAEGQRPLLQRRAHHRAVAHGRAASARRSGRGRCRRRSARRRRPRWPAPGRARRRSARSARCRPRGSRRRRRSPGGRAGGGGDRPRAAQAARPGATVEASGKRARELGQRRAAGPVTRDLARLLAQQRQQGGLGEVGVLVVVGQHRGQAARHAAAHVRALVQQRERAQHQVAGVQRAARRPAAGRGRRTAGRTRARAAPRCGRRRRRARPRPAGRSACGGQLVRRDHLLLQPVDARHEPGQQRRRVAADLVLAQGQLLRAPPAAAPPARRAPPARSRGPARPRPPRRAAAPRRTSRRCARAARRRAGAPARRGASAWPGRPGAWPPAPAAGRRGAPCSASQASRCSRTVVRPEPDAPVTSSGPPGWVTAACWALVSPSAREGIGFRICPESQKAGPACCRSGLWPILRHPPR